ncbi:hypothetical protein IWQ61_001499 [Dispira simplex]|nr:hypothetical protein IWQ61_001499 [Dispira simplex]
MSGTSYNPGSGSHSPRSPPMAGLNSDFLSNGRGQWSTSPAPCLSPKPADLTLDNTFQNMVLGGSGQQLLVPQDDANGQQPSPTSPAYHSSSSSNSSVVSGPLPNVSTRPSETFHDEGHAYLRPSLQELQGTQYPHLHPSPSSRSLAPSTASQDSVATPKAQTAVADQGFDSGYTSSAYSQYHRTSMVANNTQPLPSVHKSQSQTTSPKSNRTSNVEPQPTSSMLSPPIRLGHHNSSTPDLASAGQPRPLSHVQSQTPPPQSQPHQSFDGPIPRPATHYATMRDRRQVSSYYQMHSNASGEWRGAPFGDRYSLHSSSVTSFQQSSPRSSMFFGSPGPRAGARTSVTLLNEKSALTMYREAAKKTNDPRIQMEFAKFLMQCANDESDTNANPVSPTESPHGSPRLCPQLSATEVMNQHENKRKLMDEAVYWIRQLERQAHPEACFIAAEWYSEGKYGLPKDDDKAHAAYMISSKNHIPYASFKIGQYYEKRRQTSKALSFFQKGAAQGDVSCNFRLALAHLRGELHQTKSVRQALIYLRRAAHPDERCSEGAYILATMYLGEFYECIVDDQIFRDDDEAQKLLERAAQCGNTSAQYRLGQAFEFGECGYEVDPIFSVSYYRMAAEQGHREAQMSLSAWYLSGSPGSVEQNDELAFKWCSKSAEQGLVKAEFAMGYYYEVGIGTQVDVEKAKEYYRVAISHGSKEAQQRMDKLMGNSRDSSRDLKRRVTKKRAKKDGSGCTIF